MSAIALDVVAGVILPLGRADGDLELEREAVDLLGVGDRWSLHRATDRRQIAAGDVNGSLVWVVEIEPRPDDAVLELSLGDVDRQLQVMAILIGRFLHFRFADFSNVPAGGNRVVAF